MGRTFPRRKVMPARAWGGTKLRDADAEFFPQGQGIAISCAQNQNRLSHRKALSPAMNAPSELNFEDMLRIRLEVLRREHRDLDEAIHALEATGRPDQLTLRRLKKQKLALKDQIVKIEDQLIPDIIA